MKTYSVSYYLSGMYHTYLVDAENEAGAIQKVLGGLYHPEIMHDFKIKRYHEVWN